MTHANRFADARLCLLGLIAGLTMALDASAQDPKGGLSAALTLEPSQRSYVLGEPVYVTARLVNTGARSQRIRTMLDPSAGFLTIRIASVDDAAPMMFIPLAVGDYELPPVDLGANDELSATFQVFFGGNGWTFPKVGRYTIVAELNGVGFAALESPAASITVTRGDGAGAYLFGRPRADQYETGKFLVWQEGDHLRRAHATLDEIIKAYPDSPLVDHARLASGISLSKPFHDYSIGRVRAPQPDRALELLNSVRSDVLPDLLRLKRQLALARSFQVLSRPADAARALDSAQTLAGDRRRALGETLASELAFDPVLKTMKGGVEQR